MVRTKHENLSYIRAIWKIWSDNYCKVVKLQLHNKFYFSSCTKGNHNILFLMDHTASFSHFQFCSDRNHYHITTCSLQCFFRSGASLHFFTLVAGYPIQKNFFIAAEMCLYWVGQRKKNWHQMSDQHLNLVDWSLIASTSLASNSSYTENNLHIKRGDQTRCSSARNIYFTHSYLSKPGA